ncbi:hypothetical protein CBS101457_004318 [Exobasidium rhododendri]|nr:hypothetical protein CBS101457_004318 [Exobasidium rhododendri]
MSGRGKRASTPGSRASPAPRKSSSSKSSKTNSGFNVKFVLAVVVLAFAAAMYALDQIRSTFYIFDPADLHKITQSSVAKYGNDTQAIFDDIIIALKKNPKYSATLNSRSHRDENEWVFNNAGGAMGAMYIIHASITEYLIFFGSPVGTEGHTGRHTADDYFHILSGEQRAYYPGALVPEIYAPGSQHHLKRGHAKQYLMPENGCWALELAQGWIPPMMPFGLADTLSSTLDIPTFAKTCWLTAREMVGNLLVGKF